MVFVYVSLFVVGTLAARMIRQRRPQAAGSVKQDRFLCHRRCHHDRENRKRYGKPCYHHAPESLALG